MRSLCAQAIKQGSPNLSPWALRTVRRIRGGELEGSGLPQSLSTEQGALQRRRGGEGHHPPGEVMGKELWR